MKKGGLYFFSMPHRFMQITSLQKGITLRNVINLGRFGKHFTYHSHLKLLMSDICSVSYSGYRTLSERRSCKGQCYINANDLNDIEYQKINSGMASQSRQKLSENSCDPHSFFSNQISLPGFPEEVASRTLCHIKETNVMDE